MVSKLTCWGGGPLVLPIWACCPVDSTVYVVVHSSTNSLMILYVCSNSPDPFWPSHLGWGLRLYSLWFSYVYQTSSFDQSFFYFLYTVDIYYIMTSQTLFLSTRWNWRLIIFFGKKSGTCCCGKVSWKVCRLIWCRLDNERWIDVSPRLEEKDVLLFLHRRQPQWCIRPLY